MIGDHIDVVGGAHTVPMSSTPIVGL